MSNLALWSNLYAPTTYSWRFLRTDYATFKDRRYAVLVEEMAWGTKIRSVDRTKHRKRLGLE